MGQAACAAPHKIRPSARLRLSTAIALSCVLAPAGTIARAQDGEGQVRLEDLIPDAAMDDPDAWALEGAGPSPMATQEDPVLAEFPMDPMPDISIDWPDELVLPNIARPQTADPAAFVGPDQTELLAGADAVQITVNSDLILSFPDNAVAFPMRDAFVERFEALSTIQELSDAGENIAQLSARARADEELLAEMLRVYGYYDARISRSVIAAPQGQDSEPADADGQVRFDIIPGARYSFGSVDLGSLQEAPDYETLRAAFGIRGGDPLSSDAIVTGTYDLDLALGENGYPFAAIGEAELLIDHRTAIGNLTLPVDPNGKYVFGEITSSLPDYLPGRHLAAIARFQPGDVFQRSRQSDLRRAITATGLISSIAITPREITQPQGDVPGTVAIDVAMTKAPVRTLAGAIGYGSEEGFRLQASWEHRNLFPPEGALKFRGIAGTQEQLAGITFRRSNLGGRDRVLNLDAYATTIDSDAFDARTVAFVGSYEQASTFLYQKPLSWNVGFEIIATQERPPLVNDIQRPRQTFFIAATPFGALIDTSDDLLDPVRGFRIGAKFSPEVSRTNGRESFYLRAQFDASHYRQINDRVVIAGRTRLSTIQGTALVDIAPSRRYYAGGGASVRGYGFQQIGPRDIAGEPNGGRSVVEFSLEARVKTGIFNGAVSLVPFVDAGSVGTGSIPDFEEIKIGAGIGLRYATDFGPVRVDLGVPINPGPGDNPVAVYVSLGQAF